MIMGLIKHVNMTPTLMSLTDHLSVRLELKIRPGLLIASWMLLTSRGQTMVVPKHMIIIDENLHGNSKSVFNPPLIFDKIERRYMSLKMSEY